MNRIKEGDSYRMSLVNRPETSRVLQLEWKQSRYRLLWLFVALLPTILPCHARLKRKHAWDALGKILG